LKFERIQRVLIDQKILIVLFVLILAISIYDFRFFSITNLTNILFLISVNGIIAIGMTYLLIGGEFDLSVGSNVAFVGVIVILTVNRFGIITAIIFGILSGMLVGVINGVLITRLKINSLATTLGMMIALRGVVLIITKSQSLKGQNENFFEIGAGTIGFNIAYSSIILIVLYIVFGFILSRTIFGRNIYVIGGNANAAELFGLNIARTKLICFVITGFLCGVSGVILTSRINIASGVIGQATALEVITAVILGGTSLYGGEGTIFRTFQGVFLIGVVVNLFTIMQLNKNYYPLVIGFLLVAFLIIDAVYANYRKYKFI
jgi:ribose transport system permease protein